MSANITVQSLSDRIDELTSYINQFETSTQSSVTSIQTDTNVFWLLVCAFLVFFMQAGFAMVEVGSITTKNTKSILLKNVQDSCVGSLVFWAVGFGFAYGNGNAGGFIGNDHFFLLNNDGSDWNDWQTWIFQWAFAATAATIVSGSVAERTVFGAYMVYTLVITGFIYPVVVHWVWSPTGWISAFKSGDKFMNNGMMDFAGSGVVHMVGGFAVLAGAIVVGPRKGFPNLPPQNVWLCTLGTFILWFGWYGFNSGSTLAINGYGLIAAKVATTTTLSAASAGISALYINYVFTKQYDLCKALNGVLAGLVSITAPCSVVEPWGALIIGLLGGVFYVFSSKLLVHLGIDDPLDACPVHGFCGIWGVLAVALFGTKHNMVLVYSISEDDFNAGTQFGCQFIGMICILAWTFVLSFIMFYCLKNSPIGLRIDAVTENRGMDETKYGGNAFPNFQQVDASNGHSNIEQSV